MKTLGIIGGLGPMATAYFMELITKMTDVPADQGHLHILIDSKPATPDRTKYILGLSPEDPKPVLVETGRGLIAAGAEVLAIPCITAHYFHDELEQEIGMPILHLIRDTVKHLQEQGIRSLGIMGTDGTVQAGLFQRELAARGMGAVVPDPEYQKLVMRLIYEDVKANRPLEMDVFRKVEAHLKSRGAEAIVLGCTELSMAKKDYELGAGFIDGMEVLARSAVLACGAPLKAEYRCLLTK